MSRFCVAAVVLVVALVTVVAVVPSTEGSAAEAGDQRASVQALLDERVAAIREGDKERFMRTIDPQAADAFRDAQSLSFDGWRSVPLAELTMLARVDESGDLAKGLDLAQLHHAQSAYMPETRTTYRLADYDDRPAIVSTWSTYVQRSGAWYLAADSDAIDIGLENNLELWDLGPMSVQRTDHFLVLTKPDQLQRGRVLGEIAEEAYATFSARWSPPWSGRVPLLVPGSPEEVGRILHTTADVANFSAFTVYIPYRDSVWQTSAPRLYAQEANLAGQSRAQQVQTMVHELVHAASAQLSGPFMPTWTHEGIAEWIRLGKPARHHPPSGEVKLPTPEAFTSGDLNKLRSAYSLSTSAVAYVAETNGTNAPIALFEAIGRARSVPGSSSYNVNAALVSTIGQSIEQFEQSWGWRYDR